MSQIVAPNPLEPTSHTPRASRKFVIAVIAIAFIAMCPVLRNDFVAWDDPQTIVEHRGVNPASLDAIGRFWTQSLAGLYVPVTYTIWSAIGAIARDSAGTLHAWPFHLVSLLVHCTSAAIVFAILRRLINRDWPACIGAMLFAVHPLQVETVAWASGLKDVLAACLALAAIHQHLRSRTFLSSALLALAMLAKPSAASAIGIVAIIDLIILRRPIRQLMPTLLTWMVIALPLLIVARLVQTTELIEPVALHRRPLVALDAIGFYLTKLVAPINLVVDYGRLPARVTVSWLAALPILVATAIGLTQSRILIASGLIMLAGLVWNLGLVAFQFQLYSTVADHYMYLAMLGPALATALFVNRFDAVRPIALIAIAIFTVISFRQTMVWRDSVTLFRHAVAVNPRSIGAHNNLGRALGERGDLNGAATHFRAALSIQSGTAGAHRNLAFVEFRRGNLDTAIVELRRAIEIMERNRENVASDRADLVRWLAMRDRWPEVVIELEKAHAVNPTHPDIARMLEEARQRVRTATTTTSPSTMPVTR